MNMDDYRWKVFKSAWHDKTPYWIVYRANDFGEPMWICDTFEEAWDKLERSMGWKKSVTR